MIQLQQNKLHVELFSHSWLNPKGSSCGTREHNIHHEQKCSIIDVLRNVDVFVRVQCCGFAVMLFEVS